MRQESQLHKIQMTTENIHVSDGLRRVVAFLIIAPYKYYYLLTYLLTYLRPVYCWPANGQVRDVAVVGPSCAPLSVRWPYLEN